MPPAEYQNPAELRELRCPTCGARQAWSDTCRRCKCDLALVHGLHQHLQALRRRCLRQLDDGQLDAALATAVRCYDLAPDETHARLLAGCHLVRNEFAAALELDQRWTAS